MGDWRNGKILCAKNTPREGLASLERLNTYTNRIWRRMTVDGREDINQYDFLLSKTEVRVADYRHVLKSSFAEDVLEQATRRETSLVLLRTCLMNPFLRDWDEHDPPFTEQFADYLHALALEVYHTMSTGDGRWTKSWDDPDSQPVPEKGDTAK